MTRRWVPALAGLFSFGAGLVVAALLILPGSSATGIPADGTSEGITVHGDWVLEVLDPDGTLVERREFSNSLTGGDRLAQILARDKAVGLWDVTLGSSTSDHPCLSSIGLPTDCQINETSSSHTEDDSEYNTLTVTRSSDQIELSGTATATRDGAVDEVSTHLMTCTYGASTACEASDNASGWGFTSKTLASAVSVSNGQTLQVTVTLSFS